MDAGLCAPNQATCVLRDDQAAATGGKRRDEMMERLFTARELAGRLQCSERTIWRMVRKGLPAHRVSDRLVRFDPSVIDAWLKGQRRVEAQQETITCGSK